MGAYRLLGTYRLQRSRILTCCYRPGEGLFADSIHGNNLSHMRWHMLPAVVCLSCFEAQRSLSRFNCTAVCTDGWLACTLCASVLTVSMHGCHDGMRFSPWELTSVPRLYVLYALRRICRLQAATCQLQGAIPSRAPS